MFRKMDDIKSLVVQHKLHIFGLAEANVMINHNMDDLQIPGYKLHLLASISNPALGGVARIAVYTSQSITVKRRPDLPGKRKSTYMISYRQWRLAGQLNNNCSGR